MAYAVIQDMKDRYDAELLGQLTGSARGASIEEPVVQVALDDAHAEVDDFLAVRFDTLPLNPVPASLKAIVCDIALYRLHMRRPKGDTEEVKARYDDARARLEGIASNKRALAGAPTANAVKTASKPKVFTDEVFTRFRGEL